LKDRPGYLRARVGGSTRLTPAAINAGYLRARVGDYRIIHTIEQGVLRVLVVRVGRRRDLYR